MVESRNNLKEPKVQKPLLKVRNLSVEFGSRNNIVRAVNNISYDLHESETVAILGESGSGKSATALAMMGLLPKSSGRVVNGEVNFKDHDLVSMSESDLMKIRGSKISMIFQDPLSALNPLLSVGFQIGEGLRRHKRMSKKEAKKSAIQLMEQVRIPDAENRVNDYPYQFSGGMQQRVMIAMALALDPEVLIADEPTTALDVTVQAQIMRLLKDLQIRRKMGLILISHDLGVVADVADRVVVMYASKIVESGEIKEVFKRPAHPYTLGLMNSVPAINQERTRLVPIKGSPPNQLSIIEGCSFQPRCPFAREVCKKTDPELREVLPGRKSACHFAEEVLNNVEKQKLSHS